MFDGTDGLGTAFLLFLAAVGGGGLNSVVGGGSFLTFPALLFAHVPAVSANATSTLALWPGGVSSAVAYRRHLGDARRRLLVLGLASLAGGIAGSLLLLHTKDAAFRRLVPWLLLAASVIFTFGSKVTARLREQGRAADTPGPEEAKTLVLGALAQLVVATYGGFFGGGMGILMLAEFSLLGLTDIHQMNALRNILATIINGVALVAFVAAGAIAWRPGLAMVVGAALGGYGGAVLATRMNPKHVRAAVTVVAWGLTAYFFVKDLRG